MLKNPGNRRSSKNGVVITLALFGVERAVGDAARLAGRTTVRRAVPPAKNSESASAASAIVIGPKIGVFQHNTSITAGRLAQKATIPRPRCEYPAQPEGDLLHPLMANVSACVPSGPRF
jgi:hypothetical protein